MSFVPTQVAEYANFWVAMRQMFISMLGGFDFSPFEVGGGLVTAQVGGEVGPSCCWGGRLCVAQPVRRCCGVVAAGPLGHAADTPARNRFLACRWGSQTRPPRPPSSSEGEYGSSWLLLTALARLCVPTPV